MKRRWNDQQQQVLSSTKRRLLILGPAGSGKTTLIPHCLKKLSKGEHALILTPSRKDALLLKKKTYALLKNKVKHIHLDITDFCAYGLAQADSGNLGFIDERDRQILLKECFRELNLSEKTFSIQAIGLRIRNYKQNLLLPTQVKPKDRFERAAKKVYALYAKKLDGLHLHDVEDLFILALDALEKKKNRLQVLIADDYQELFQAQHLFFQKLSERGRQVYVFADPLQNCFGYYGTSSKYAIELEQSYTAIHLVESFRLADGVIGAAQKLSHASKLNGVLDGVYSKKKGKPKVFYVRDEHEEAWLIGRRIQKLRKQGRKYASSVVFFRNPAQGKCFEEAFTQLHIPYQILLPETFFEEKKVKDVLSYLRLLHNPYDFLSLKRVMNIPHRGIGSTTLKKLEGKIRGKQIPYAKFFSSPEEIEDFSPGIQEKFQSVFETLSTLEKKKKNARTLIKEVQKICQEEKTEEKSYALTPWESFQAETDSTATVEELIHHLYTLHPLDYRQEQRDQVILSHIALNKVSEFDIVFIAGMEEGIFPQRSAMLDEKEMEIERKLCYAAMSRAREQVYFLYATNRTLYGGSQKTAISRFLGDMDILSDAENPNGKKARCTKKVANGKLKKGSKVFHKMWGEGAVKSIVGKGDQATLVISFATVGEKTLLRQFAPIETIG